MPRDDLYWDPFDLAASEVVLVAGSAVRDERPYPDPKCFDIQRKVDLHLAFGYGIYFCLGAAPARMEGRIALEETLGRFPSWRSIGADPSRYTRARHAAIRSCR